MADKSVISAKLRPGNTSTNADIATDGLAGVLSKSVSVAGLKTLEVQVEANCKNATQIEPQDFIQYLPETRLALLIECDLDGQIGLISADMNLINAIADGLTGSLDKGSEAAAKRIPTPIDIALTRPFFDTMLSDFSEILAEFRPGKQTDTYHTSETVPDPSPHQFPDQKYLQLSVDLDFESGARHGQILLMLPAVNTEFASSVKNIAEDSVAWKHTLNKSLNEAPTALEVVLHRRHMPIGQIMKLKTGDVVEIPSDALEKLSIESKNGTASRCLMRARLGEFQEMRAAKITSIGAGKDLPNNGSYLIEHSDT